MECGDVSRHRKSFDPGAVDGHGVARTGPQTKRSQFIYNFLFPVQNNCMSVPVVFLDSMLDQELANRLATIITKHQVTQSEALRSKWEPHCARP